MPSGKVHDKISFTLLPIIAGGSYLLTGDIKQTGIVSASYLFSALMFSGDLDIKSKQSNRWGILSFIWIPYRKIFSHRSKFTHSAIIGTIVRVLYLATIIFGFLILGNFISNFFFQKEIVNIETIIQHSKTTLIENIYVALLIFVGLTIGALSHTITDVIYSNCKKLFRNKKKQKRRK